MAGNYRRNVPIAIPGWDTQWIHLGPGPVGLGAARLTFGTGTVVALRTGSAGILRGRSAAGGDALVTNQSSTASLRWEAQHVGGDSALLLGSATSVDLHLPEGGEIMIIAVPGSGAATGSRCLRLNPSQVKLLGRCADSMQQLRAAGESQLGASGTQRTLRALLRSATDAILRDAGPHLQARPTRLLRHLAVIRACDYIESHLDTPISLAHLCAAAGVSTRALEYGFRDFYELGPMAYVRIQRLCRVRDDLLNSSRRGDSVSNTARRWCFTHMGQFSHDYRELFGEMPSMTLARPGHELERHGIGVQRA